MKICNNMNYTRCIIPLLALLFIPVGMSDTLAQSEPDENFTDVGPVGTVNEENKNIKDDDIEA